LQDREQHVLDEVLRGGPIAQVPKAVGVDAPRESLAQGAFVFARHGSVKSTHVG
jgi:hypothetical protein